MKYLNISIAFKTTAISLAYIAVLGSVRKGFVDWEWVVYLRRAVLVMWDFGKETVNYNLSQYTKTALRQDAAKLNKILKRFGISPSQGN